MTWDSRRSLPSAGLSNGTELTLERSEVAEVFQAHPMSR